MTTRLRSLSCRAADGSCLSPAAEEAPASKEGGIVCAARRTPSVCLKTKEEELQQAAQGGPLCSWCGRSRATTIRSPIRSIVLKVAEYLLCYPTPFRTSRIVVQTSSSFTPIRFNAVLSPITTTSSLFLCHPRPLPSLSWWCTLIRVFVYSPSKKGMGDHQIRVENRKEARRTQCRKLGSSG